jgi:tetratricopeptide (TPR) repeat protein
MSTNRDSALTLLNKATDIDSNYYIAFGNKVSIYASTGDYKQAIVNSQQVLRIKPDLAEAVVFLGILYDKSGQIKEAKEQYNLAIRLFDKRLLVSDKNQKANKINRVLGLLLVGEQTKGMEEIKKLQNEYPNDLDLKALNDFDKGKHIDELLPEKNAL